MKGLVFIAVCLLFPVSFLLADKTQPGLFLSQDIGASYNPIGAAANTKLFYRLPLINSDDILWASTKIDAGVLNTESPAYDELSAFVTIQPIAIFNVTLRYGVLADYNVMSFGYLPLNSYSSSYDSTTLSKINQLNASGYIGSVEPVLQVQVGPWIFVNDFFMQYFGMSTSGFYYNRDNDVILNNNDIFLANNDYLFYQFNTNFMLGLDNTVADVPASTQYKERLCLMGVYTQTLTKGIDFFGVLLAGTFFVDPNYQYQPYLAIDIGLNIKLL